MTTTKALQTALTQLSQAQDKTQQQLNALIVQTHHCCERVDSFVAEVQQNSLQHSDRIANLEGITERLDDILADLVRRDDQERG